jgi:hypothetical protein
VNIVRKVKLDSGSFKIGGKFFRVRTLQLGNHHYAEVDGFLQLEGSVSAVE